MLAARLLAIIPDVAVVLAFSRRTSQVGTLSPNPRVRAFCSRYFIAKAWTQPSDERAIESDGLFVKWNLALVWRTRRSRPRWPSVAALPLRGRCRIRVDNLNVHVCRADHPHVR